MKNEGLHAWIIPKLNHGEDDNDAIRTQDDINQAMQEAKNFGFEAGKKEGFDAGMEEAKQKINEIEGIIDKLRYPYQQIDVEIENTLVKLISSICEHLYHKMVEEKPEVLVRLVQEGIQLLKKNSHRIEIRMNPSDLEGLKERFQEFSEAYWVADENLQRGDVFFQSNLGELDASVSQRIQLLIDGPHEQPD